MKVARMGKDAQSPLPSAFSSSPVSSAADRISLCFETKPLIATLLAVTLVMAIWNLQPYYQNLIASPAASSPPCHCSTITTLSTSTVATTTPLNSTTLLSAKSQLPQQQTPIIQKSQPKQLSSPQPDSTPQLPSPPPLERPPPRNPNPNKREFQSYGNAAALFVQMGAYRGGPSTFSVIGLASKPLHVYGTPWYKCEWIPTTSSSSNSNTTGTATLRTTARKILPDWGYGRVYTVVVVNCTFPSDNKLTTSPSGGKLILKAHYSLENPRRFERFVALEEQPGEYNPAAFNPPPYPYSYLYCGSPLYGNLNPDRIREWVAYHTWFFGPKSHFVLYDAGGVTDPVRAVLEPWIRAGRVTLQDARGQAQFDGYYYNQFLIVNDCLHRYRFAAKWTFFFDVDEYIYLPGGGGNQRLEAVMGEFEGYTQFTIQQNSMSSALCLNDSSAGAQDDDYKRQWGFEKLVFRDSRPKIRRDRKYAIQARNALATGVHMSENVVGKALHRTDTKIRYYHYHNSIQVTGEPCRVFLPPSAKGRVTVHDKLPFVYDQGMKQLADTVKQSEREALGNDRQRS